MSQHPAPNGCPSPVIAAYIADVVPAERQQRAYVLQSWAINCGYAIGPIVANQLVKVSYSLMFYVEVAVMVGVTVLLIAFFREVRHLGIAVSKPREGSGRATGDSATAALVDDAALTDDAALDGDAGAALAASLRDAATAPVSD